MTLPNLGSLALLTIKQPAQAAKVILALNVGRDVLWIALALAVVLNTLIFSLSNIVLPTGPSPIPGLLDNPVFYGGFVGGGLVLTIFSLHRVGRMLGGTGSFDDVMILMVWMQFLRVTVQALALLLVLTIPILSVFLIFGATIVGLFIFLHFIDQAHRLGSMMRAGGVLLASLFAIAATFFILLSLIGGPIMGSTPYV